MQFRAPLPLPSRPDGGSALASSSFSLSVAAERTFDAVAAGSDETLYTTPSLVLPLSNYARGNPSPKKPPHFIFQQRHAQIQPGTLLSINQSQSPSQHKLSASSASSASNRSHETRSSRRRRTLAPRPTPEPIDYLQLRRTEHSKHALLRTRHVVREILAPASASGPPPSHQALARPAVEATATASNHAPLSLRSPPASATTATNDTDMALALHKLACFSRDNGRVDDTALTVSLQQLCREQQRVDAQSHAVVSQLHALLAAVGRDVSLPHSFAPLLRRIYTHHKLTSRWRTWRAFVTWHRLEQPRVAQLTPFAVRIQRAFRRKRTKWTRAHERLTLACTQWQAAVALQRWSRRQLRVYARQRASEALYAARLQAAWRGRQTRRQVKRALQDRLRCELGALTPTGTLHRLHEVLAHSPPALVALVNHALSLVAETHMVLAVTAHCPQFTGAIAAKHLAHAIEPTRQQLVHAVFHVHAAVRQREQDVAAAKLSSVQQARAKRHEQDQRDEQQKRAQLVAIQERLAEETARTAMQRAELETREHMRALQSFESDARRRWQLQDAHRAHAERSRMLAEEFSVRYVVAESRRRALQQRQRLEEVAKREQFLQKVAQQELADLAALVEQDELKRLEARQGLVRARAAEHELWTQLSRDEKANAVARLERREQERRDAQRTHQAKEDEAKLAARETTWAKDARRERRQREFARELEERAAMGCEDQRSRRSHLEARKQAQAREWTAKREKERLRYALDPMHFAQVEAQKQLEERERRERKLLASEDVHSAAVQEAERKAQFFQRCRAQQRQRLVDGARESRERACMQAEEERVLARLAAERRADTYQSQLQRMRALAAHDDTRERNRILEARGRQAMHDEELRQRRVQQARAQADAVREQRERQTMDALERGQRATDAALAKRDEKRQRVTRNLRMMKEDVESMARQDWEAEGRRLEQLLWSPVDAAAFAHVVASHSAFLATNVEVVQELVPELRASAPPFDLDYDTVRTHAAYERELSADCEVLPPKPKPRKPRRFFYHEFFEDDSILSRAIQPPTAATDAPTTTTKEGNENENELRTREAGSLRARERWQRLSRHFFHPLWGSEAARRGRLQLHNQQYAAAFESLHEAMVVVVNSSSSHVRSKPPHSVLVRQLAQCCWKLWEHTAERSWLDKSLFFLHQAAVHVQQLTSPSFLQEMALVLEQAGSYRAAGDVLGGIIQCFPRYTRLAQVVFRGAVVLVALRSFRQAREYLLHVLEAQPFGCWAPHEVQFLVARVLQLEGAHSRRLCEVAYEDAFRRHRQDRRDDGRSARHQVTTWQEWIRAADTWRRFGDACFAKREFVLARDAYHVMRKRGQLGVDASVVVSKRQQVRRRMQRTATGDCRPNEQHRDGERDGDDDNASDDWLRLARVSALLNDRHETEKALRCWLERRSYRERVLGQFCAWPLVRWKLLGVAVPERVVQLQREKEAAREAAEATRRQEIEAQRQQVLVRRANRARTTIVAWEQLDEPALLGSEPLGAAGAE